jgi:2-hydroxychromene-2-carboxylate isomerase
MPGSIDFFLFYGSVYTYLAVMRIEKAASKAGLSLRWRPFNLREILVEQGNTGFTKNQVRMNYCWRDVERRALEHGLPFAARPPYPVDGDLLGLRVGITAALDGWCAEYSRATYEAWFLKHKAVGERQHVEEVLAALGKPVASILARAESPEVAAKLSSETDAARQLGVFGAPTFVVGSELFWGDDRMESAIAWAKEAKLDGNAGV